tara:strand:+ start:2131 stop:2502 length:372 start_codon:yes stop_codon:yes gene_type:complete
MVLPKQLRLRGYKSFEHLYKQGTRYYGSSMVLRVVFSKPNLLKSTNNKNTFKCAVSISHKVSKKAVTRNKLRRILHEHLIQRLKKLDSKSWALISLKPDSSVISSEFLLKECDKLLSKAGLLK